MMWLGVRVFGASFLPTPFRWGFGKRKKYKKCLLKLEEAQKAKLQDTNEKPKEN